MGKKPESEKNTEYDHTCRANFYTIRKRLGLGQEAFYKHYIKPLSSAYEVIDGKQFVDTLERGTRVLNCEILKMYSDLANVSINELMTTDLQEEHAPNLRNAFNALFTVLEALPIKVSKNKEHGIDIFTMTTSLSDELPEIDKDITPYLVNVFLEEYAKHKDLEKANYLQWKQSLLRGAFNYAMNGIRTGNKYDAAIVNMFSDAYELDSKNFDVIQKKQGREAWLKAHNYLGYTEQEWHSFSKTEQEDKMRLLLFNEVTQRIFDEQVKDGGKLT